MAVSRRRFVQGLAVGAALPAAGALVPRPALATDGTLPTWSPDGGGATFGIDREMAVASTPVGLSGSSSSPAESGGGARRSAR